LWLTVTTRRPILNTTDTNTKKPIRSSHPNGILKKPSSFRQEGNTHEEIGVVREIRRDENLLQYENSNEIIQTSTVGLSEDRVNFPVRISNKNPIIMHRYSILVRQYVQTLAAHTFYKTLKQLSGMAVSCRNQPGFLR
jgi:hypothetical protein